MELRQLAYVVAVVDHGTFTRAAVAEHVTQPSLSQGIRALEQELGVELFTRVGRRAVLSAAGAAFVGPARQTLRDAQVARQAALSVRGLEAGQLDIATLPTLAVAPLAGWVGAFRVRHPGIKVVVTEPETALSIEQLVREARCDLALAELPVAADLVAVPLGEQTIVAVAPADLPVATGRAVPLARLAEFPLVCTPTGTSTRDLVDAAFGRVGAVTHVAVETAHREALVPLVLAGGGLTFLPQPLADDAASRGARIVRTDPPITRRVGLVHRAGPLAPAAAAFLDLAVAAAAAVAARR